MRKKFVLTSIIHPLSLTVTDARRVVGTASLNRLKIGESIDFTGIGNPFNFTIKRVN